MAVGVAGTVAGVPKLCEACGCFAPPTVGEPIVQAGERIVFAHRDGKVVAHIQIQYQGEAKDFAWLLPLPAEPELTLGTEELFAKLDDATGPQFVMTRTQGDGCNTGGGGIGCSDSALFRASGDSANFGKKAGVAVKESSAGPYEYAVVRADEKQPMIDWLNSNGYFVPAGTAEAVDAYIRPGAFFLALRLKAGQSAGDLQPVVVEYASERPMIPIILTAVAANPDMGVLVWVLGDSRAIPHNYQHVHINEQLIDWPGAAKNYAAVVTKAIDEAESHRAFITEFAGSTDPMLNVLYYSGRFGSRDLFEGTRSPYEYVLALESNGFWPQALVPILSRELDIPAGAFDSVNAPEPNPFGFGPIGETIESQYFTIFEQYAQVKSSDGFDPVALTTEIWDEVVTPTIEASKLFRENRKMTRLFTTLSPEEMTEDPVFAFNPDLEDVSNIHNATLITHCEGDLPEELVLQDQRAYRFETPDQIGTQLQLVQDPATLRIEVLRQEGQPEIVTDNFALLAEGDDVEDGGCIGSGRTSRGGYSLVVVLGIAMAARGLLRRRRRA
jgi:hypothetical protein